MHVCLKGVYDGGGWDVWRFAKDGERPLLERFESSSAVHSRYALRAAQALFPRLHLRHGVSAHKHKYSLLYTSSVLQTICKKSKQIQISLSLSLSLSHTHTHTHHTHMLVFMVYGDSLGVWFLYCTNCMCYCPTPTLHLNLALTGDGAFLLSPQKTHSVWFISVLNYGDTENVLINHLLLVIPMSYPCHYTNLCPHNHINMPTHTHHTHTHTHTHSKFLNNKI